MVYTLSFDEVTESFLVHVTHGLFRLVQLTVSIDIIFLANQGEATRSLTFDDRTRARRLGVGGWNAFLNVGSGFLGSRSHGDQRKNGGSK